MAKAKKKRPNTPRAKRMGRLQSAVSWLKVYNGNSIIRGYRKHYGVDVGTAIIELLQLGAPLSEEAIRRAKEGAQAAAREKQVRKENRLKRFYEDESDSDSDETYAYIAGYTGWGVPYGITWEETDRFADMESLDRTVPLLRSEKYFITSADELNLLNADEREAEEVPFDLDELVHYFENMC
ncbi:hypothetical protein [Paenibacillus ferrarius]|uniref:hypothetical protein n=1 Tax=Paenibacillus ferrarius TaxID=1469647 RepID=UPI003D2CFD6A